MISLVHNLEESIILSSELEIFSNKLKEWLPRTGNWHICWRAGRHGWNSTIFHEKCDGKKPTLTLVNVVKENKNFTFGGYATRSWGGCK